MRKCRKCRKKKPEDKFYKYSGTKQSWCEVCMRRASGDPESFAMDEVKRANELMAGWNARVA
jgi:hypothetical protein